jgi:hypothetical protein
MPARHQVLAVAILFSLALLPGCNNTLNPLCGSSRAAPIIGSLSPSTVTFAQVQQGVVLTVTGSQFVSASEVVVNGTTLSTTAVSNQELQVTLTTAVITGPGSISVSVHTPTGNSSDFGCTSGGTSSALVLTVS